MINDQLTYTLAVSLFKPRWNFNLDANDNFEYKMQLKCDSEIGILVRFQMHLDMKYCLTFKYK
jgi:hypothetical protein